MRIRRLAKKRMKKHHFDEDKEIKIQAESQTIMPIVDDVARELSSHNLYYEARRATTQESKVRYNVLVMEIERIGATEKRPIGAFTLH